MTCGAKEQAEHGESGSDDCETRHTASVLNGELPNPHVKGLGRKSSDRRLFGDIEADMLSSDIPRRPESQQRFLVDIDEENIRNLHDLSILT
jgi:hypothetical protein